MRELGKALKSKIDTFLFDGCRYYRITLSDGYKLVISADELDAITNLVLYDAEIRMEVVRGGEKDVSERLEE